MCLCQVRSPETAKLFLDRCDKDILKGRQLHRVANHFYTGKIRIAMDRCIATGVLDRELDVELESYRLCTIDDTMIETPHRDASNEIRRAPRSRIPAIASQMRVKQNLRERDRCFEKDPQRAEHLWSRWKTILSPFRRGRLLPRRPRILRQHVVSKVYRLKECALEEWSWLATGVGAEKWKKAPLSALERLQKEYLEKVLQVGQVYSLSKLALGSGGQLPLALQNSGVQLPPALQDSGGQLPPALQGSGGQLPPTFQDSGGQLPPALQRNRSHLPPALGSSGGQLPPTHQESSGGQSESSGGPLAPAGDPLFFERLESVVDKKHVKTSWFLEQKEKTVPVSLQFYKVASTSSPSLELCFAGTPCVVDALLLANWATFQEHLLAWKDSQDDAPRPGRRIVKEGSRVSAQEWDLNSESTPMFIVLKELVGRGWGAAQRRVEPLTSSSPKRFLLTDMLRAKWLPRCMLQLEDLEARGLSSLSVKQAPSYYVCIAKAEKPSEVTLNMSGNYYDRLGGGTDKASSPEEDTRLIDDEDPMSFCNIQVAFHSIVRQNEPWSRTKQPRRRQSSNQDVQSALGGQGLEQESSRKKTAKRRKASEVEVADSGPLPEEQPSGSGGPLPPSTSGEVAAEVPSGSGGPLPPSTSGEVAAEVPSGSGGPSPPPTDAPSDDMPFVENVRVRIDIGGVALGLYHKRYFVLCPLSKDAHGHPNPCMNSRTSEAKSSWSELEPWAYLGCWIRACHRFGNRGEHMSYKPSVEEMGAYMREKGWPESA